uniref:MULE transposase domain-containing protein n=1 Tax=Ditylenchus dipsaci TaxID=166011 RepID=A0A915DVW1_9BILA
MMRLSFNQAVIMVCLNLLMSSVSTVLNGKIHFAHCHHYYNTEGGLAKMQRLELAIEEYESPKRGKATKFKQLDVYENEDLFNAWSSSALANWKLHQSINLEKSRTEEYLCKFSRLRNCGCQMKLRIKRPHDSEQIIVEQSYGTHEHKLKKPLVLNESVKKIVREDKTLSAMQIQDKIEASQRQTRSSIPLPSVKQLENLNKHHLPEDFNEPYVVKFDTRVEDETEQFCLVWSTRRLFEMQKHSRMLQVDGTYKTNWLGFPILLSDFSDSNCKFLATFMALVSSETTWSYKCFLSAISSLGYAPKLVMGDGDTKISAGAFILLSFVYLFLSASSCRGNVGHILRAMCFAHVMPNLDKKLRPKELKRVRMMIEGDVCFLQQATSEAEFVQAVKACLFALISASKLVASLLSFIGLLNTCFVFASDFLQFAACFRIQSIHRVFDYTSEHDEAIDAFAKGIKGPTAWREFKTLHPWAKVIRADTIRQRYINNKQKQYWTVWADATNLINFGCRKCHNSCAAIASARRFRDVVKSVDDYVSSSTETFTPSSFVCDGVLCASPITAIESISFTSVDQGGSQILQEDD